jgi:hypothetical protein
MIDGESMETYEGDLDCFFSVRFGADESAGP